ncbi:hypothetical protein BA190_09445 [Labrys sp. WJW]|nr:hypothetical protein BA190_09445 [Labrys sp. WJW]
MVLTYGVNLLEPTVLDSYARRRMITSREYEAGILLAKVFRRAIHLPSVTASYGEAKGGGGGLDTGVDARKQLWSLLLATGLAMPLQTEVPFQVERQEGYAREPVLGPVGLTPLGSLVLSVCGYDDRAGGTRRIKRLRQGLNRLADNWNLPNPNTDSERHRIGKYIAPGPRPTDNPAARDLSWSNQQNEKRKSWAERRREKAERRAAKNPQAYATTQTN